MGGTNLPFKTSGDKAAAEPRSVIAIADFIFFKMLKTLLEVLELKDVKNVIFYFTGSVGVQWS